MKGTLTQYTTEKSENSVSEVNYNKKVNFLIFDWGDTLFPSEQLQRESWKSALRLFHDSYPDYPEITMRQFAEIYWKRKFTNDGAMFSEDRLLWMKIELDHPSSDEEILKLLMLYRSHYKSAILRVMKQDKNQTLPCLREIKDQYNIKLGILSDNSILTKTIIQDFLKYLGYGDLFDFFIVSEEVGCEKPKFDRFIDELDGIEIKPSESLYFGNDLNKDSGSLDVNIPFIHVSGYSDNSLENGECFPEVKYICNNSLQYFIHSYP